MSTRPVLAALALAAFACSPSFAADISKQEARKIYEQDKADCMAGRTNQSRADCLYEARSALRDAGTGRLADSGVNYDQNQQSRCQALSGDELAACNARMKGEGVVSGDAPSGGIYRELTVVQPAAPATKP